MRATGRVHADAETGVDARPTARRKREERACEHKGGRTSGRGKVHDDEAQALWETAAREAVGSREEESGKREQRGSKTERLELNVEPARVGGAATPLDGGLNSGRLGRVGRRGREHELAAVAAHFHTIEADKAWGKGDRVANVHANLLFVGTHLGLEPAVLEIRHHNVKLDLAGPTTGGGSDVACILNPLKFACFANASDATPESRLDWLNLSLAIVGAVPLKRTHIVNNGGIC
mmetsp:Transcript_30383/g.62596  ORF Transcript_30383/g.62596 Transcript_30383/m.62596 type:complete len:234 (-) Transcript_30383:1348-2049(-)